MVSEVDARTLVPPATPAPIVDAVLFVIDSVAALSASVTVIDPSDRTASPAVRVNESAPAVPDVVCVPVMSRLSAKSIVAELEVSVRSPPTSSMVWATLSIVVIIPFVSTVNSSPVPPTANRLVGLVTPTPKFAFSM